MEPLFQVVDLFEGLLQHSFCLVTLNHFCGLRNIKVSQTQVPLRRTMRLPEMRRKYAQGFSGPAEQRRRLHRAKAGGGSDLAVRLEPPIGLDVFNDDSLPMPQRPSTSGSVVRHAPEIIQKVRLKAALRNDL